MKTESSADTITTLNDRVALRQCGYDADGVWQGTIPNPAWTPTTEELADYFRDVVPPAWMGMGGFACGEPHHHDEHDQPVYLCFRFKAGLAGWEARYCTVPGFRKMLQEEVDWR